MLDAIRKRLDRDEEGFTLIELMVVVLIIAILIAIAIPTFLGAQDRARDRGAQSDLRNALTAAKTIATDHAGLFVTDSTALTVIDATAMEAAEPSLTYDDDGAMATGVVEVTVAAGGASIVLTKESASGETFGIRADSDGTVTYCKGTEASTVDDTCDDASW